MVFDLGGTVRCTASQSLIAGSGAFADDGSKQNAGSSARASTPNTHVHIYYPSAEGAFL